MLAAWQQFIYEVDPDVMTGWNISNFDLEYLITRSRQLDFNLRLGRLKNGTASILLSLLSLLTLHRV